MKMRERWVVKAGSNMVCSGGPLLIRAWMQQLSLLRNERKIEVVWVTSGAIASAVDRIRMKKRDRSLPEKQALSAIGQPLIMDLYNVALQTTGMLGAQILLTYDDLAHEARRKNFQNTVETLLKWGVTPILNENDAVATEEIKFGDNDSLSAKVARVIGADRLLILTDVDGLYDSDPRKNTRAKLLHSLSAVNDRILKQVEAAPGTSRGTGGMYSKLKAAKEASSNKIETWLVRGDRPRVLLDVEEGKDVGTRVSAAVSGKKSGRHRR
jgi:glutamate 5-kinase